MPLILLLGLFSLGASCKNGQEKREQETAGSSAAKEDGPAKDGPAKDGPAKAEAKPGRVDKLDPVDTAVLTDPERRTFFDLANEVLSPCGDPVSVARCVSEKRACSTCVPAARYLVRLVSEGFEKAELKKLYADRFDPKRKVDIDIAKAPVKGEPMAKVTIVEFSDFECPHCGAAHPILSRTVEEFQGKVNLVFKHFPLDSHKNAAPAARAAVAAQAQGKFWPLADLLFENQRALTPEKIRELAKKVGVDVSKFDAELASADVQARVDADKKDGNTANVQGTPTLFINGREYNGGLQSLAKYLKEELEL
ncbi:MAG: thioredoxin domain-containing protein [Polyangiales bacterium]